MQTPTLALLCQVAILTFSTAIKTDDPLSGNEHCAKA